MGKLFLAGSLARSDECVYKFLDNTSLLKLINLCILFGSWCVKAGESKKAMMEHNPLIGKTLAADYKIVSLLGRGGMGSVYLAEQVSLKRQVAVKFLPTFDLSKEQFCRFEAEIAAMATLCHPNIVAIHHRGKYGEPPMLYYVMEYLEGGSLKEYLQKHGKIPSYMAVRLIRQIAEALAYAHEQGCIHRDIKSDNLLFNRNYRSLKIADFGIAKMATGANITQSQSMVGTFLYAAPEQMRWFENADEADIEIDERADQYSLGTVLYEMLSGSLPYQARNFLEMMKALSQPPLPLSADSGISRSLEWLVETMTAKAREERFSSDDELLEAISNVEMESTVSTRIFSIKTEEHLKVAPPKAATKIGMQMPRGEFPSHSEKIYMQNLQTVDCYAKRYPVPGIGKKLLPLIGGALLLILAVGYWLLSSPAPATLPPKNGKPPIQPPPATPQPVLIKIALNYDVKPPADYPSIQIIFLASQHSQSVHFQDKILPGQYQLSVILPGYSCQEHGQRLTISPEQPEQQLKLTLRVLPRKVAADILNAATGQAVRPLRFSLNEQPITGAKTFKPGDYRLYAQFKEYHSIDTPVKIPPGNDCFRYKAALIPLKQVLFSFRPPQYPKQEQLEVQIDDHKVARSHLQYQIKAGLLYVDLRVPNHAQKIILRRGFYYSELTIDQLYMLRELEYIDGDLLLEHLRTISDRRHLDKLLAHLWQHSQAKIRQLSLPTQKTLYELLRQQTTDSDYANMKAPLWRLRQLLDSNEADEYKYFQRSYQAAQSIGYRERNRLWQRFAKNYPAGIYRHRVQAILEYLSQVRRYEEFLRQSVQECYISPSEKRILSRMEKKLEAKDIQEVRHTIASYVKEKCDRSLEAMLNE